MKKLLLLLLTVVLAFAVVIGTEEAVTEEATPVDPLVVLEDELADLKDRVADLENPQLKAYVEGTVRGRTNFNWKTGFTTSLSFISGPTWRFSENIPEVSLTLNITGSSAITLNNLKVYNDHIAASWYRSEMLGKKTYFIKDYGVWYSEGLGWFSRYDDKVKGTLMTLEFKDFGLSFATVEGTPTDKVAVRGDWDIVTFAAQAKFSNDTVKLTQEYALEASVTPFEGLVIKGGYQRLPLIPNPLNKYFVYGEFSFDLGLLSLTPYVQYANLSQGQFVGLNVEYAYDIIGEDATTTLALAANTEFDYENMIFDFDPETYSLNFVGASLSRPGIGSAAVKFGMGYDTDVKYALGFLVKSNDWTFETEVADLELDAKVGSGDWASYDYYYPQNILKIWGSDVYGDIISDPSNISVSGSVSITPNIANFKPSLGVSASHYFKTGAADPTEVSVWMETKLYDLVNFRVGFDILPEMDLNARVDYTISF